MSLVHVLGTDMVLLGGLSPAQLEMAYPLSSQAAAAASPHEFDRRWIVPCVAAAECARRSPLAWNMRSLSHVDSWRRELADSVAGALKSNEDDEEVCGGLYYFPETSFSAARLSTQREFILVSVRQNNVRPRVEHALALPCQLVAAGVGRLRGGCF